MAERMAGVLAARGAERALVVHGDDGLDELTITTTSQVVERARRRRSERTSVDPAALGLDARHPPSRWWAATRPPTPSWPARVLAGEPGPHRDIVHAQRRRPAWWPPAWPTTRAAGCRAGQGRRSTAGAPPRRSTALVAASNAGASSGADRRLDARHDLPLTDERGTRCRPAIAGPTRDRLVAARPTVFAEKGYDRAGVQEIARRAGFTTGAIYGRFRGKAELLLAAIEAQSDDEFEQLFAEHRFEGKATDIITTVGSHLVTEEFDNGQALLLEAFVAARRDPEVAAHAASGRRASAGASSPTWSTRPSARAASTPTLDTLSIVRFCHAVAFGFLLFGAVDLERARRPEPWEELIDRLVGAGAGSGRAGARTTSSARRARRVAHSMPRSHIESRSWRE